MPFDLAIFGSGFAAYEIARQAMQGGKSVIVIEKGEAKVGPEGLTSSPVPFRREPVVSGGFDFGANVRQEYDALPRYIGLGGTSELWSGKWRRLDRVDVTRTLNGRRWPMRPEALDAAYDQVAVDYGWPDWSGDPIADRSRALAVSHGLRLVDIFEEASPLRLRQRWSQTLSAGAELLCSATVQGVEFDRTGREMRSVTIASNSGSRVVNATRFVIACGGIESVHMSHQLRQSRGVAAAALPTRYSGYVDHPKAFVGSVTTERHHTVVDDFATARADRRRLLAFGLAEDELTARQVGNHTVFLWPTDRPGTMRLVINLEQFPEPGNFIQVQPPAVSWRLGGTTWRDYHAFMDIFAPRLQSLFGPVTVDPWPAFRGASHPACCLPMSESPDTGALDANCRFHDQDNLFCVSSAAFPLAGSANPTMTVMALARRFGELLNGVRSA